ncbi:MAG: hypothetical protein EZS28_000077 [Streblomastix strix]|uniref:Uncharacterized protein n=1 Tax=Streblomastix strix TaxID=222440 RepID=A0A5J4XB84_9EUKA|nr:MAG: hypothetical protein EZS28_000077 [Streblomastix strix]
MWTNQLSFEEQKKSRTNTRQMKWVGSSEDINGDKFPEYVVRDHRGFIQSADGLRITVPIKRQRVIKYFSENRTKEERQEKNYKQLQEEENPADGNRLFIKNYLSSFLKERDYTIAQVCSVIGGRIWKGVIVQQLLLHYNKSYQGQSFDEDDATSDNLMMRLIQVGCVGFWNSDLGEIHDVTNEEGVTKFSVPTEQAIKEAKLRREEKELKNSSSMNRVRQKQEKEKIINLMRGIYQKMQDYYHMISKMIQIIILILQSQLQRLRIEIGNNQSSSAACRTIHPVFDEQESFEAYVERMKVDGELDEGRLFHSFAQLNNTKIENYVPNQLLFSEDDLHPRTIRLGYVGLSHYISTRI